MLKRRFMICAETVIYDRCSLPFEALRGYARIAQPESCSRISASRDEAGAGRRGSVMHEAETPSLWMIL